MTDQVYSPASTFAPATRRHRHDHPTTPRARRLSGPGPRSKQFTSPKDNRGLRLGRSEATTKKAVINKPNKLSLDIVRRIAKERERKEALDNFERALHADELGKELYASMSRIDVAFCWREAMLRVLRIKEPLHINLRFANYHWWVHHAEHIRLEVGDDLLLTRALRKLLPPYQGGDKILYRGEYFRNRKFGTYGLSWTPLRSIATGFCTDAFRDCCTGGAVLLKANVPRAAIIAKIHKGYDSYQDKEYLVDRTKLPAHAVRVVKAYPQDAAPVFK